MAISDKKVTMTEYTVTLCGAVTFNIGENATMQHACLVIGEEGEAIVVIPFHSFSDMKQMLIDTISIIDKTVEKRNAGMN